MFDRVMRSERERGRVRERDMGGGGGEGVYIGQYGGGKTFEEILWGKIKRERNEKRQEEKDKGGGRGGGARENIYWHTFGRLNFSSNFSAKRTHTLALQIFPFCPPSSRIEFHFRYTLSHTCTLLTHVLL